MQIKNLILWRHADAEIASHTQSDIDRALTEKGHRQAKTVSKWLNRELGEKSLLLTSPALRAKETAAYLDHHAIVEGALQPGAMVDDVLELLAQYQRNETVVVVGHQPWLGELAASCLNIKQYQFGVKKSAVWWLRMGSREISQYQLFTVQTPQLM